MPQVSVAPLKAPHVYREPVVLQRYPEDILAWIAERRDEHDARCGIDRRKRDGYRLGVRRDGRMASHITGIADAVAVAIGLRWVWLGGAVVAAGAERTRLAGIANAV